MCLQVPKLRKISKLGCKCTPKVKIKKPSVNTITTSSAPSKKLKTRKMMVTSGEEEEENHLQFINKSDVAGSRRRTTYNAPPRFFTRIVALPIH